MRWFKQDRAPTLWGRAYPSRGLNAIALNTAIGDSLRLMTVTAHEVAHLAGKNESAALKYEVQIMKELLDA